MRKKGEYEFTIGDQILAKCQDPATSEETLRTIKKLGLLNDGMSTPEDCKTISSKTEKKIINRKKDGKEITMTVTECDGHNRKISTLFEVITGIIMGHVKNVKQPYFSSGLIENGLKMKGIETSVAKINEALDAIFLSLQYSGKKLLDRTIKKPAKTYTYIPKNELKEMNEREFYHLFIKCHKEWLANDMKKLKPENIREIVAHLLLQFASGSDKKNFVSSNISKMSTEKPITPSQAGVYLQEFADKGVLLKTKVSARLFNFEIAEAVFYGIQTGAIADFNDLIRLNPDMIIKPKNNAPALPDKNQDNVALAENTYSKKKGIKLIEIIIEPESKIIVVKIDKESMTFENSVVEIHPDGRIGLKPL